MRVEQKLPGSEPAPTRADRNVSTAATQLEAYFLRRVLADVRGSGSGGLLDGGFAGGVFREMLDESMADAMSSAGGIGLGKLVAHDMDPGKTSALHAIEGATPAVRAVPAAPAAPAISSAQVKNAYRSTGAISAAVSSDLALPLAARESSESGARIDLVDEKTRNHPGLDQAAPGGSRVGAAAAIELVHPGTAGSHGALVIVDHGEGRAVDPKTKLPLSLKVSR